MGETSPHGGMGDLTEAIHRALNGHSEGERRRPAVIQYLAPSIGEPAASIPAPEQTDRAVHERGHELVIVVAIRRVGLLADPEQGAQTGVMDGILGVFHPTGRAGAVEPAQSPGGVEQTEGVGWHRP